MGTVSKNELLYLNQRVWDDHESPFPVATSLDSSMKKNTAFIKRIRTGITASAFSALIQDISSLSLHRYLSELVSACYEGLCKVKASTDVMAAVRIVSALHQRFGVHDFTKNLLSHIVRGLYVPTKTALKAIAQENREKEEKERISRQRALFRIATELWLVGVIQNTESGGLADSKEGAPVESTRSKSSSPLGAVVNSIPLRTLKELIINDKEHAHLPLIVGFVKAFQRELFDGQEEASPAESDNAADSASDFVSVEPETRRAFVHVLTRYFGRLHADLLGGKQSLDALGRRNAEVYVKSGEVFEDRQANFEAQSKSLDKLISNVQALSEILHLEMPDLSTKETVVQSEGIVGMVKSSDYDAMQTAAAGIWEDEEERRFYENIVDLKDKVPISLLEQKKKRTDNAETKLKRTDSKGASGTLFDYASTSGSEAKEADGDDLSAALVNKTVVAQLESILSRLVDLSCKEAADEVAQDFCYVNSKASRNRLLKALQDIPKGRFDLLPLYSRLVATLGKYMPDVSQGMVEYLDDEFRSLQRRKQKEFLGQVRMMNIKYLGELTKFGAVPEHVIFHCLKVTVDDFSRMNIDIMCTILENCGRYLFRNKATSERMASFLETIQRKKSVQNLGQQERLMIENAYYYVNPPPRQIIKPKERAPVELFVRKLVYSDLKKGTLQKILRQLKRLHWEEPETQKIMHKVFSKPDRVAFNNVHLLAAMLSFLARYHPEFSVSVVDAVLESVTFGLELNDFQFNQRRIANIKYLGELYVYKLVDSPVIFHTLYHVLTYGHEGGVPSPEKFCSLDLPDDFFRIRLVCNLLETCATYFKKGSGKKKLDFFLTFFQYYIFTKDPLPLDIEFLVQDVYTQIRPRWKLVTTFADAANLFSNAVKNNYKSTGPQLDSTALDPEEIEHHSDHDMDEDDPDENDDDAWLEEKLEIEESNDEDSDNTSSDEESESSEDEDDDDDDVSAESVKAEENEFDRELEAEFDRELAKLMAESYDPNRKPERKPVFNNSIPIGVHLPEAVASSNPALNGESNPQTSVMRFAVLTKKGNKPQTRTIDLPSESNLAQAVTSSKQAEEEERQRIKQLVLNYNQSSTADSDSESLPFPHPSNSRIDKASKTRSGQRSRKLQLEDVMW